MFVQCHFGCHALPFATVLLLLAMLLIARALLIGRLIGGFESWLHRVAASGGCIGWLIVMLLVCTHRCAVRPELALLRGQAKRGSDWSALGCEIVREAERGEGWGHGERSAAAALTPWAEMRAGARAKRQLRGERV